MWLLLKISGRGRGIIRVSGLISNSSYHLGNAVLQVCSHSDWLRSTALLGSVLDWPHGSAGDIIDPIIKLFTPSI